MINPYFWKDKTVLITGHTGFKGSWLSIWLHELGAKVIGYALDPYTEKDNFVLSGIGEKIVDIRADIRNFEKLNQIFDEFKPDIVFHMAAQPLVRLSYKQPIETYEINVMGTINILEAIRACVETKVGVFITSDKCYENKEQIWGYKESDSLGGYDPYSSSKGAAEIAISSWRRSFFNPLEYKNHGKAISSVRAGNVIGGGDWALDRIIPDCIRAIERKESIEIRSPKAIRPWQHVLEPLSGYLLLAQKMWDNPVKYSSEWNFGPQLTSVTTVWDIANKVVKAYEEGQLIDVSNCNEVHEAKLLALDISKVWFELEWKPTLTTDKMIAYTIEWYKQYKIQDVYGLCNKQIIEFLAEGGNV